MKEDQIINAQKFEIESDVSEIDELIDIEEFLFAISKSIIEYRQEHNLTQKQLAQKLNMNQTMVSKLESGNYNPTFKVIYKISRKLTNSSEFFLYVLDQIKSRLMKVYNYDIKMNYFYRPYLNSSLKDESSKIIEFRYDSKEVKGGNENGKRTSRISNVG